MNDNFPTPPADKIDSIKVFPDHNDRVITFELKGSYGSIIGKSLEDLITLIFGDPAVNSFDDLGEGEQRVYKIIVERKYTDADLEKLPESDGDIG